MLKPSVLTWILVIFGLVFIFVPMVYVQFNVAVNPNSQQTKDMIIGRGEDYRDKTHVRVSYGIALSDLIFWLPLLAAGSIGVILGRIWGYILWGVSGAISVYISIILLFTEREYVYPSVGPLVYYTIFWGFFVYWGVATIAYATLRLSDAKL
ncbi:MAG: hypothetical protein AMS17_02510 [Spirochaetes bacterium DG_61]|nr:MAG: hypothetical protein AMS17_02510 [Spirochaetes bacterium DG_61]